MKKLYFLVSVAAIINYTANGQGTNCSNAINLTPTNTLTYATHTSSAKEMWFKFTAQQSNANLQLKTKQFGNNQEHAHEMTMYSGTCGSQTEIKKDELSFVNYSDELAIDMNATGLTVGQTYYLKIDREAHTIPCDKSNCTANNSSNPATFDLAVQNINVLIPLDFNLEQMPIALNYEQNRGQLLKTDGTYADEIKIYNKKLNPATYISENKTSFVWAKIDNDSTTVDSLHRVNMFLENANQNPQIFRTETNPIQTNYFLAHTPKGVHNKESYGRPIVKDVYNKIDMQFSANEKGLKMFFTVHPSGNADDIEMRFDGATAVNVTSDSSKLEIVTPLGILDFEAGHAYQINFGNQIVPMPWQAKFIKTAFNKIKLDIRNYAQNMPLFIQIDRGHIIPIPSSANNNWSTYFDNNGECTDIVAGDADSVYVTGFERSNYLPATPGAFQTSNAGNEDIFIAKFKDAVLMWATYYGSDDNDKAFSIDVNGNDVYIVGYSESNSFPCFPSTNPFDGTHLQYTNQGSYVMGVIIRLNTADGFPKWATFFGGITNPTYIYSVATAKNGTGNIFITGTTLGKSFFPLQQSTDANAYFQVMYTGAGSNYTSFIAAFNSSNHLIWNTYFGAGAETGWDITVKDNDVYVAGETSSYTGNVLSSPCLAPNDNLFPLCNSGNGAFIQQFSSYSNDNSFIARFTQTGQLKWSTLFGSTNKDIATGIAVNSKGDAYVSGYTFSNLNADIFCDVPTNNGFPLCNAIQSVSNATSLSADAFIAKFNSNNQLAFSTFYGGITDEKGYGYPQFAQYQSPKIAIDQSDNIFITGPTDFQYVAPNDFPTLSYPTFYNQSTANKTYAAKKTYLLALNYSDQLIWSTLYDGWAADRSSGIAAYNAKHLYINGSTSGVYFPTSCPTPTPTGTPFCIASDGNIGGGSFIARFDISILPPPPPVSADVISLSDNFLIFPNPVTNTINISADFNNEKIICRFFNSKSQLLKQDFISPQQKIYSISLPDIQNGIYLLQLQSSDKIISKKIIKLDE